MWTYLTQPFARLTPASTVRAARSTCTSRTAVVTTDADRADEINYRALSSPGSGTNRQPRPPPRKKDMTMRSSVTGTHMIVLPGGGYAEHAPHEAEPVAQWLSDIGRAGKRVPLSALRTAPAAAQRAAR